MIKHGMHAAPSPWVVRFAHLVPRRGVVLDVACGSGRHVRHFLARGNHVVAVDRELSGLADLVAHPRLELLEVDLEDGGPFPLAARRFSGVVVTNYLYRPILPGLVQAVKPGGALIYETFARGNERFGRPHNPAFLLRPGELLDAVRHCFRVVAYEDVDITEPRRAAVQRICAVNQKGS